MSAKSILRRWLAEGEIERTIEALQRIAESSGDEYFMDEVILVSGGYSGLQKERRKGLIGDEAFRVESAKIRDSLLSLTGEVPADAVLEPKGGSSQAGIEQAANVEAKGELGKKLPNPKSLAERPEPASPAPKKVRSWFFGIGINRYRHFSALHNAVKDVQDICRVLQGEYGLVPEHTITLFDEEATRENIITRLDELARLVTPEDKLLIYYSGHGHLNETAGRGFWIPHDARKQNTSQYIHNSIVKEYLEDINSLHTLLISDACFSGSLFYRGEMKAGEPSAVEELERRRSRWALCSGRHDEQVYDGEPGENSPFAAGILDSLQQPGRLALHVARLVDEVVMMTRANYRQTPEGNPMFGLGHKGGQYVFRRQGRPANSPGDPGQEEAPAAPVEETLTGRASWLGKGRWILGLVLLAVVIVVLGLVFRQEGLPGLADPPGEGTEELGGRLYRTLTFKGGLTWMAENLNYDVGEGSWCFGMDTANCSKYGRLYTLEAARKACAAVGWELPSDRQWREMAAMYGGVDDESGDRGREAFRKLSKGGDSRFDVQLGGRRDAGGDFINLGSYGFYWSSTEHSPLSHYYFTFDKEREELNRWYTNGNDAVGYSCRCIRK